MPCFDNSNSYSESADLESDHSNSDNSTEDGESTWVSVNPFHMDISGKRAFYVSMNVNPPHHLYRNHCSVDKTSWTVNLGDIVAIQIPQEKGVPLKPSPFTVNCGYAEVITIFKQLSSVQDTANVRLGKACSPESPSENNALLQLEVRWLWTLRDIFKSGKRVLKKDKFSHFEILYEGDSVDICEAESLLGPTMVHYSPFDNVTKYNDAGIPLAQIYIEEGQLVQLNQKQLTKVGSSDKRFERGMMYSQFLKVDSAVRASFDNQLIKNSKALIRVTVSSDWKAQFMSAMNTFESGEGHVVGREEEKQYIKKFLYDAIRNTNGGSSNKMTMLIGGPPGKNLIEMFLSNVHVFYSFSVSFRLREDSYG